MGARCNVQIECGYQRALGKLDTSVVKMTIDAQKYVLTCFFLLDAHFDVCLARFWELLNGSDGAY